MRNRTNTIGHNIPKDYFILVDIANTERYVQGAKVEWKTFVAVGADPTPRILRFDSQTANPGVDLLDISAPPFGTVEWRVEDNTASGIVTNGEYLLEISIPFHQTIWFESWYDPMKKKPRFKWDYGFTEEFLTAGEHVYSVTGSNSRFYYDGSMVDAKLIDAKEDDIFIVNTFPWAAFMGNLESVAMPLKKTKHLVQPIGPPVAPDSYESGLFAQLVGMVLAGTDPEAVFSILLNDPTVLQSGTLPTLYYAVLDLYQGLEIYVGEELPKMVFSLKKNPMAVFINFEIPVKNIWAFKNAFLPDHFYPAKIKFYPEQEKAVYAVSLNVYEAVGQSVSGYRAEWSTYVINPREENPKPRFSVIEAQTTSFGFDPQTALERFDPDDPQNLEALLEPPADVFEYSLDEIGGLNISILDIEEDIRVNMSVAYPAEEDILFTHPLQSWMEANDFVYWGETADILKYDGNVMFADLIVFEAGPNDIVEDSAFAGYVDPEPLPIILWNGVQDIALEPWGNLQDINPRR
jgi:hypothetical protein